MGSPPQVRAPSGAVLSATAVVSLALGTSLVALLMAPLVRTAHPSPLDTTPDPDDDECVKCCLPPPPNFVNIPNCNEIEMQCDCCHLPPQKRPAWCKRGPPENPFYLIAQIALGAALVVAITALVSIVLRTCSGRRRNQERPQFRPGGASNTSLDMYVQERMQDCPPCYDEISWEKPPSYSNLPIIEQDAAEAPHRREPPPSATGVSDRSGLPGAASPPPYPGVVFTISQRVEQPPPPPPVPAPAPAPAPAPQVEVCGEQVVGAARAEETSKEAAPEAAGERSTADA